MESLFPSGSFHRRSSCEATLLERSGFALILAAAESSSPTLIPDRDCAWPFVPNSTLATAAIAAVALSSSRCMMPLGFAFGRKIGNGALVRQPLHVGGK